MKVVILQRSKQEMSYNSFPNCSFLGPGAVIMKWLRDFSPKDSVTWFEQVLSILNNFNKMVLKNLFVFHLRVLVLY